MHHLRNEWPHLGLLSNDGGIKIHHSELFIPQKLTDPFQQNLAVDIFVTAISVREMLSDISQTGRAQKGIHNGMGQNIRIGMTQKSQRVGNFHTAQNQLSSFHQLVYIIAVSDPHASARPFRISSATFRSRGVVILMFSSLPSVRYTWMPSPSMAPQSSV